MNIRYQYHYVTGLLKRYGFRGLVFKTLERSKSPMLAYTDCYKRYMPTKEELERQKATELSYAPLVSIVVPAYETPEKYLRELVDTVQRQSYQNWELCLADGSQTDIVERTVAEYAQKDTRIRYQRLLKNGGISENTNGGFAMAKGSYIALMDHDDLLTENALYEMVQCLNESYTQEERTYAMIYSDEDKINGDGSVHSRPHFKPDFNPEFLRHNNYFCHFLMFSAELLKKAGGLQKEYDGAQDYDFVLRCVDAGAVVRHVPKILYHWRIHEGSTAGNSTDKAYAFDNGCRAIEAHLERCGEPGKAKVTTNLGVYNIEYMLRGEYELTVVTERKEELARIREHYKKQEFTGDYRLNIHYMLADSFHNGMEKECFGDYILYVKRGVKVEPEKLIETLLGTCQYKRNGMAGAKLLTKKKRVVSCGMIYDSLGNLIPSSGGIPAEYKGYFLHAVIPQNVSAISLGCVMFRRDAFAAAGGMDQKFRGIYRDADYCFRLQQSGYQVVVIPEVTAVEYEPQEADVSSERQKKLFLDRWEQKLKQPDPCYNCNLSLQAHHTYAMKE